MIILAEAILQGALQRNESRGAHYKPAYPQRNDEEFLKATIAEFDPRTNYPRMSYAPVDISLAPPRGREYGKKADIPAAVPARPEKAMA
jgi:succinate dehydrogenase / fumarate reductase flavoprotein subunit